MSIANIILNALLWVFMVMGAIWGILLIFSELIELVLNVRAAFIDWWRK